MTAHTRTPAARELLNLLFPTLVNFDADAMSYYREVESFVARVEDEARSDSAGTDLLNSPRFIGAVQSVFRDTALRDMEAFRIQSGWPTPIAMRQAADGLDKIAHPRYGDILRWVADLCDTALAPKPSSSEPKL